MPPDTLIIVLLIGTLVGFLPGLFGVGGAFVTVPALHLLAGVPLDVAIGSAACQVLGPATAGLLHRRSVGTLQLQLPLTMTGGMCVGIWLGLRFVDWAGDPSETWEVAGRTAPRLESVMLFCYFLLLVALAVIVALEWRSQRVFHAGENATGLLAEWRIPPSAQFEELEGRSFSIPIVSMLGVVVGFLNGGMGMGGGIVMVPALVSLVGMPTQRAINATLVLTWLGGIGTTLGHAREGHVDLPLVCLLLAGGTAGGKLGSILGERMGGHRLRGYFALLIVLVALVVGGRLLSLFWP
jgi:uncharacterized membrane protein YfcA